MRSSRIDLALCLGNVSELGQRCGNSELIAGVAKRFQCFTRISLGGNVVAVRGLNGGKIRQASRDRVVLAELAEQAQRLFKERPASLVVALVLVHESQIVQR